MHQGNALVGYLLRTAIVRGCTSVFALTTQTAHYFVERGFKVSPPQFFFAFAFASLYLYLSMSFACLRSNVLVVGSDNESIARSKASER